jgi:hypothetical protein
MLNLRIRTFKIFFQRSDNTKFFRIVREIYSENACLFAERVGIEEGAIPLWPFVDISPWRHKRDRRSKNS